MKLLSFYHKDTGLLNGQHLLVSDENVVALNTPADHLPVEGHLDCLSQKVDLTQAVVLLAAHESAHGARVQSGRDAFHPAMDGHAFNEPARPLFVAPAHVVIDHQPEQPSVEYEWNPATKRWELNEAAATRKATRAAALARIALLEGAQHRALREVACDPSNAEARKRIDAIDAEIATLRADL